MGNFISHVKAFFAADKGEKRHSGDHFAKEGLRRQPQDDFWDDQLRSQAHDHFTSARKLGQLAQNAYLKGDHEGARKYSQQKNEQYSMAYSKRAKACENAFSRNNQHRAVDEIDLHGLYVDEALDKLSKRIRVCRNEGYQSLNVVTGLGNHSPSGVPKIRPKVLEYLDSQGISYNTNGGCIAVWLDGQGGEGRRGSPLLCIVM